MAWIYFLESVASQSHLPPGCEQSPIVTASDSHNASCCPECRSITLTRLPFGTTCARCPQTISHKWTSSQGDSRARTSVLQELDRAWQAKEAAFSLRSSDSFASSDHSTSSWSVTAETVGIRGHTPIVLNTAVSPLSIPFYRPTKLHCAAGSAPDAMP